MYTGEPLDMTEEALHLPIHLCLLLQEAQETQRRRHRKKKKENAKTVKTKTMKKEKTTMYEASMNFCSGEINERQRDRKEKKMYESERRKKDRKTYTSVEANNRSSIEHNNQTTSDCA